MKNLDVKTVKEIEQELFDDYEVQNLDHFKDGGKCSFCDEVIAIKDRLIGREKEGIRIQNKITERINEIRQTYLKTYKCQHCDFSGSTKIRLYYHLRSVHPEPKDSHQDTSATNKSKEEVNNEADIKDVIDIIEGTGRSNYHVEGRFSTVSNNNVNNIKCDHCEFSTSAKEELDKHINLIHSKLKDMKCKQCGNKMSAHPRFSQAIRNEKGDTECYFKYHEKTRKKQNIEHLENFSGCARSEPFKSRSPFDMFSWLVSRHRTIPNTLMTVKTGGVENRNNIDLSKPGDGKPLTSFRHAAASNLPMAMKFRKLGKHAKEFVGVFSSRIHGRGLFCKNVIESGQMIIEYAGEEIRAVLTEKREKLYEKRGIGCYMFKIDNQTVIDATMKGSAARFINHSCDPNCYSRIVDILGKKHIIIFSITKILPGEEITYDYKFPFEDVKIPCNCSASKCRKYMN